MKITYYGHSCTLVEHEAKRVIIDPFLSGNPPSGVSPENIEVDAVILTHGHDDHFGDCIDLARRNNCPIIAVYELAVFCSKKGVQADGLNIGGARKYDGFEVKLTSALHSSSVSDGDTWVYAGQPAGVLLTMGGHTFYHAGDTALFSDLRMIGEMNSIACAALPIGDALTMGPQDALLAAQWLRTPRVIPVHYNTFPGIEQDGQDFCNRLKQSGIEGYPLTSGQSLEI
ncbi:metallo-beta-lactamase domain protein [Paenibacillus algicola]|uniref:UPF0173 metal-dependent hydrolase E6C60_3392 n=1 Tax=Paenibacillus algicola TaxID=2565926 RepID=A0A4P8XNS9_9BACL|nr:metal-dependent hydrolase [Paenibacillus algicola]QCT04103.1 metallo-beta-lactamase domain protein [Paenibacillus algicola]